MPERELVGGGRALRADRGPRAPVITRAVRALAPWLWPYFSLTTRGCGRTGSGAARLRGEPRWAEGAVAFKVP